MPTMARSERPGAKEVQDNIRAWLRYKMEELQIDQRQLSQLVGFDESHLSKLFSGERGAGRDLVIAISEHLDIPITLLTKRHPDAVMGPTAKR